MRREHFDRHIAPGFGVSRAVHSPHAAHAEAGIVSEPFPTLAEEKGIAVRPLTRPADAKATPITALFWNKDWAAKNPELAQTVTLVAGK